MLSRKIQATLLLIGTIVGVGMFGIPFVFVKAGFLTGGVELILLAFAALAIHLAYAEITLATPALHRLPGYVRLYLGERAGWLARATHLTSLGGSLLVYLVVGGPLLSALMRTVSPASPEILGPLLFYLFGVGVIFFRMRWESATNAVLTLGLMGAILVLAIALIPQVPSFGFVFNGFRPANLAVPYGVLLFALTGAAVIPDVRNFLGRQAKRTLGRVVIYGMISATLVYFLFALAVAGATGLSTTPEAIRGIAGRFGSSYGILGSIIGVLATMTSFIPIGLTLKGALVSDFGAKEKAAWLITALVPALPYFLGWRDFIAIITFLGAVAVGLDSVLILLTHGEMAKQKRLRRRSWIRRADFRTILFLTFAAGILYELFSSR